MPRSQFLLLTLLSSFVSICYAAVNGNVRATVLVIASDADSARNTALGLNGYAIPYQTWIVGSSLPALNASGTGNFGGIVIDSGDTRNALTTAQRNTIFAYQVNYGVRLVQLNAWPQDEFGAQEVTECCNSGVTQDFYFSNTSAFSQAGLKANAGLSTDGLWHYGATITDPSTTTEIARNAASSDGSASSYTAAVINNFSGRQQMVYFIPLSPQWSTTSAVVQHAWITWITRGLYTGFRRTYLSTQIDDMLLETNLYSPSGSTYRVTTDDMSGIKNWVPTINAKMPSGSSYVVEIGYNGNGNFIQAEKLDSAGSTCVQRSIQYPSIPSTDPEFKKPLGTGTNKWPATPTSYSYSVACSNLDPLTNWLATPSNRDTFAHVSHTFTHEYLNNATYSDALKEIQFNQAWFSQVGISSATRFTSNGLIPPAITGIHNGDVLRAWHDAGLTNCVGDNTRPLIRNAQNDMWPYITTVAADGYAGFQVNPRWSTRIYYDCDTPACTTQEWTDLWSGTGRFDDLLSVEKSDVTRYLFGLYHDPYMFHQANLRNTGNIGTITINGVTYSNSLSIFQAWVETVVQEFTRLATWPLISQNQAAVRSFPCSLFPQTQTPKQH